MSSDWHRSILLAYHKHTGAGSGEVQQSRAADLVLK